MNAANSVEVAQQVTYLCEEGFAFHPKSTGVLVCNATNGEFEPSLPECEKRKFKNINSFRKKKI